MVRESLDKNTQSKFNILSSYFTDVFYNHIYNNAKSNIQSGAAKSTSGSITEEYRLSVSAYLRGITTMEKYYADTITQLHKYYSEFTRFKTLSLNEFIDHIVSAYVPEEYTNTLSVSEKSFFMNDIICNTVKCFYEFINVGNNMCTIIDERTEENAVDWTNKLINVQIEKRDVIFGKFARKLTRGDKHDEGVDPIIVNKLVEERDKLWNELEKTVKLKMDLTSESERAKKLAVMLRSELEKYKSDLEKLQQKLENSNLTAEKILRDNEKLKKKLKKIKSRDGKAIKIENISPERIGGEEKLDETPDNEFETPRSEASSLMRPRTRRTARNIEIDVERTKTPSSDDDSSSDSDDLLGEASEFIERLNN